MHTDSVLAVRRSVGCLTTNSSEEYLQLDILGAVACVQSDLMSEDERSQLGDILVTKAKRVIAYYEAQVLVSSSRWVQSNTKTNKISMIFRVMKALRQELEDPRFSCVMDNLALRSIAWAECIGYSSARNNKKGRSGALSVSPKCNDLLDYRTMDGLCNNVFSENYGKANTPQLRFLTNAYSDGKFV